MGRKSRYSEYAKGMKKKADAKNAAKKIVRYALFSGVTGLGLTQKDAQQYFM